MEPSPDEGLLVVSEMTAKWFVLKAVRRKTGEGSVAENWLCIKVETTIASR